MQRNESSIEAPVHTENFVQFQVYAHIEANILPKLLILTFPRARTHKPAEAIKMIFGVEADLQKFEIILKLICTPLLISGGM